MFSTLHGVVFRFFILTCQPNSAVSLYVGQSKPQLRHRVSDGLEYPKRHHKKQRSAADAQR
jgi:hypothetical protein